MNIRKAGVILLMMILSATAGFAQKPIDKMTKEDVLAMKYDELADLPLDELMRLADIVGVSIDDLFNMVLNKDVSIASKSSESFFDTPLSTSVLSAEDIARAGVLSIPEALRLMPGVIVREKTNGNYDVHIRGNDNIPYGHPTYVSENTLTLVMLDGRPVFSYSTGGTFWESLPVGLSDVDRIEVVRGPASALYGANAVTGVINIITKKVASKKPSVEASIQSGNRFSGMPSSLAVSGAQNLAVSFGVNDKLKFRVSGNYNYRDRTQEDVWLWRFPSQTPDLPEEGYYSPDEISLVGKNTDEVFDDPSLSLDAYGVNAYVFYNPGENTDISFAVGKQKSTVITSNIDNGYIAHTTRQLETQYADLHAAIHGFNLQASYMWGFEDMSLGSPGYQFDLYNLYINADYNFRLLDNKLSIRPGLSYARSMLNDIPHQVEGGDIFLNGQKYLSSYAPSVRLDYSPFEKLRLVGALRYEQNEIPDRGYPTWQLVANYKLHEASSIRATYSRANRSPFMLDMRADASLKIKLPYQYMHSFDPNDPKNMFTVALNGNPELKLATMDMFELGYRRKLGKHVLLNLEGFYSKLRDISCLDIDKVNLTVAQAIYGNAVYPYERHQTYNNVKETSQQYGITAEFGVVVNQNVNFRLFGTYQYTKLKKHDEIKIDDKVDGVHQKVIGEGSASWSDDMVRTDIPVSYINTENKATPSFYGGYEVNWLPSDRWTFTSTGYGYTKQTFIHQYSEFDIKAKMLVNMRVAYKFMRSCSVFMNVNNIFNSKSQEFGFMDQTGVQWYWGVHIMF